ncbi:DUF1540 domain-containing protein [Sporanaerobium hydrogeniformans]|uniref:DUF1540 domain-containing protein n=1 Tax=Sporanaerobium hydrogeniformans TaxID=3072179 RepID=UPI002694A30E|nr:DUF1540 domain-containing protein [Sporanaerobium hydrogeniformans]
MNMSIECLVTECKYNNGTEKYCTLNRIKIIKHGEGLATSNEITDCASFECKN